LGVPVAVGVPLGVPVAVGMPLGVPVAATVFACFFHLTARFEQHDGTVTV